ncbi:MAG: hypothetical protein QM808_00430 [Steroidobacteraceae bacterium]
MKYPIGVRAAVLSAIAGALVLAAMPLTAQISQVKPEDLDAVPQGHQDIARGLGPVGGNLSGMGGMSGMGPGGPGGQQGPATSASSDPHDLRGNWSGGGRAPGEDAFAGSTRPGPQMDSKYELALLCLVDPGVTISGGQIFQTDNVITWVRGDDLRVRRIYLNKEHPKDVKPTYGGHSVGKWQGNTLVVDTVALMGTFGYAGDGHHQPGKDIYDQPTQELGQKLPKPTEYFKNTVVMVTPTLHVVERFTKINNNTQLQHELSFDDPATGMKPYNLSTVYSFGKPGDYLEQVCEDGNDMFGPDYAEGKK